MAQTFTKKGYGRIYVLDPKHIERVKSIIEQMDQYEYSYMPQDLIVPFDGVYPELVYLHKFSDLNLDHLIVTCLSEGIAIFCLDNGFQEHYTAYKLPDNSEPAA